MSSLRYLPAVWGLVSLALGGCGAEVPEGRVPVFPASGHLTVNGQPAAGVLVVLHPTASPAAGNTTKTIFPSATTNEEGDFQITTYEQHDGAPAGEYVVTLRWLQTPSPGRGRPVIPFAQPVDRFGGKYNNPQTSPWHVTITEGTNVLQPITIQ